MQISNSNAISNAAQSAQELSKLTLQISDKVSKFNNKMLRVAVKDKVETQASTSKMQQINELA